MANVDGYVKRLKSLLLLIVGVTVLTFDIADSGRRLNADLANVERLFLSSSLTRAELQKDARITEVDGQPAADWLVQVGPLPDLGLVVDVIKSWDVPGLRVDGFFRLSNGESVEFTRLPFIEAKGGPTTTTVTQFQYLPLCDDKKTAICHRYSFQQNGGELNHEALLVYSADREQAVSHSKRSWRYFDKDNHKLIMIERVESKIVRIASPWIGTPKNAEAAYSSLREKLRQRTVRIPVLNVDIKASRAALFLSMFAFVTAVLMTHSLLAISSSQLQLIEEPWIMQISGSPSEDWVGRLEIVLSAGGAVVTAALVWCPVVIVGLAIGITQSVMLIIVQYGLLIAILVVAVISTIKLMSIIGPIHCMGQGNRFKRWHL